MRKTETRWAIAVALILTGCATAYQPKGFNALGEIRDELLKSD